MNIQLVSTWNCWLTPFDSHRVFERPQAVAKFNEDTVKRLLSEANSKIDQPQGHNTNDNDGKANSAAISTLSNNGLIISSFQEALTFNAHCCTRWMSHCCICNCNLKCGKCCQYNINCSNDKMNSICEILSCCTSLCCCPCLSCINCICVKCLNKRPYMRWEGQNKIAYAPLAIGDSDGEFQSEKLLKCSVGIDSLSMKYSVLVDSGLLILCNWKPVDYGFIPYKLEKCLQAEIIGNMGTLWAYFESGCNYKQTDDKNDTGNDDELINGTIIFNTHLTPMEDNKLNFLNQLKKKINDKKTLFIEKLKIKNKIAKNENVNLEIIVTGDFNLDIEKNKLDENLTQHVNFMDGILADWCKDLQFIHVSCSKPSNAEQLEALDHIFYWHSNNDIMKSIKDKQSSMIKTLHVPPWDGKYVNEEFGVYEPCQRFYHDLSDHCWKGALFDNVDNNL